MCSVELQRHVRGGVGVHHCGHLHGRDGCAVRRTQRLGAPGRVIWPITVLDLHLLSGRLLHCHLVRNASFILLAAGVSCERQDAPLEGLLGLEALLAVKGGPVCGIEQQVLSSMTSSSRLA